MKTFSSMRKLIVVALIAMGQWAATQSAVAQTVVEYLHTDALGSPVAVTNQAGTVIERNDYEPYGAVIGKPNYQGIGYTGHVQDAATGLTYMQQRYYDPMSGRFLSVDPVTALSNPVGMFNRYWYANNNPYKFTDPDGRCSLGFLCDFLPAPRSDRTNPYASVPGADRGDRYVVGGLAATATVGAGAALIVPAATAVAANPAAVATAGEVLAEAAGVTGTATVVANGARALSVEAKAAQLSSQAGASSVTIKTANGQVRYDLQGASHFSKTAQADVPTPHVQGFQNNVIPSGPNAGQVGSVSKTGDVRPATMQDLRTVEKALNKRGQ